MTNNEDEMRKEYDFSGGVRGKHFKRMKEGHQTIVHKVDGDKTVRYSRPIILEPDIQEYFPNSEAVNNALRGLIDLTLDRKD